MSQVEYLKVNEILKNDIYVDDCISGEQSEREALKRPDKLEVVLNRGGFVLKGITFSIQDPPELLSDDDKSINVAGMIWFPIDDVISLDMNFAMKIRGRKPTTTINIVPSKLTRRDGNDKIPYDLRPIWESHFQMMNEIKISKYQRVVIPEDAIDTQVETLDFGDASREIACIAIYARFKRKHGNYSCQLVFAPSRLIPTKVNQPRAELYAALINNHTGEVVSRTFGQHHTNAFKFTDSQIVLH